MKYPIGTKWVSKNGYTWIRREGDIWECIKSKGLWELGTRREVTDIKEFLPVSRGMAKFVRPFDEYLKELLTKE